MKNYYFWFLAIIVLTFALIVIYRSGYDAGFAKGQTTCPAIYPHEQIGQPSPAPQNTPQGVK